MIQLDKSSVDVMSSAVIDATAYSKGTNKKKLQAAIDTAIEAVGVHFFKARSLGWIALGQRLNSMPANQSSALSEPEKSLMSVSIELLRNRHLLYGKNYDELDDDLRAFVMDVLCDFYKYFIYAT
jgi:hypothetical protein